MRRWARPRQRPSEAARHRLADAIRRNQAELEVQVAEGLLRSELYLETGHPEQAAEILEEQRERVRDFESRLQRALASAAIEAEAEAVLAGAEGVHVLHAHGPGPTPSRVPQLLAAAVAALAAMGALFTTGGADAGEALTAGIRIDATDRPSNGLDVTRSDAPEQLRFRAYGSQAPSGERATPAARDELAREWLAQQETLLQRLGVRLNGRAGVLRELEAVVAQLIPGATLGDEVWLRVLSKAARSQSTEPGSSARSAEPRSRPAGPEADPPDSERGWFEPSDEDGSSGGTATSDAGPGTPGSSDPSGDTSSQDGETGDGSSNDATVGPGPTTSGSGEGSESDGSGQPPQEQVLRRGA